MAQLIAAVIATVAIVVFAMSNTHHVHLSMAVGSPFQFRLITLMAAAFLAGMVTTWIGSLARHAARQAHKKRTQALAKRRASNEEVEA